jgi:hypothetical protein
MYLAEFSLSMAAELFASINISVMSWWIQKRKDDFFLAVLRIRIRRIRMFLGFLDQDANPPIIKQKIVGKTLIPTVW